MKKNSCTPINPKKYSCYGLKKIHTRNLITKKNSCGSKIPPPPPITFLMVRPLRVNVFSRSSSLGMFRRRDEERRLSYRLSRPLLMISMMASQFLPFFRKHCTLTTTVEMGYIYSNHLHFLSNLLKCPVGQHRKWHFLAFKFKNFWGSMPPDGDSPCFGAPSNF